MNCLILYNNLPFLEMLKASINKFNFLKIEMVSPHLPDVLECLNNNRIDLLITDIHITQQPDLYAIKAVANPPLIILLTAQQAYVTEPFDLEFADYIVQAAVFPKFLKIHQNIRDLSRHDAPNLPAAASSPAFFYVNTGYSLIRVNLNEITFIEGLKDYVKINLTQSRNVITRMAMKGIENKLDCKKFMRIHRSFIIAVDQIDMIQKTKVIVAGQEIPVSDGFKKTLQDHVALNNFQ
ncbi:LytR/AlgR family response regulator transcription factor [Mucilaginibacter phyllosphaerae]|uniref:DNA-binding LytR/AlgR family response regulator n=1 Tax=Mucilaginibacter phyllosphaerae TaxID=1812349 RepID=A0A4Y8AH47_9SPHI|nr:LytTR family DNA-binding domain-containing protein [Mucilaginibacter phyllosphaerae]MBB3968732.1 DNA-binding LytR/AlgR family response regulator [Mucilaginibacter phyllosphaerae]TEW67632.1 response regulator transcription factor [Mucilaginibacter phyllosphaerae]GGH14204.1 DNA-binding response regulator [Mucilaginibacter phyllosphaerae]